MRRATSLIAAVILGTFALAIPPARAAGAAASAADSKVTIPVEGLSCASCTVAVRRALRKLDGVKRIEPGAQENAAVITYDAARVKPEQMVDAINHLGFKAGTPVKG